MAKCGTGGIGMTKEQIFQTCLIKALSTVYASQSLCNAQEFQEAVELAKRNYVMELQTLEQKKAMLNAPYANGGALGL